ncbi:hypothetical protein [Umezawaea tangerina]|uniref:Ferritin-like metal-binding protein YciE n=1 Tax=Umezawaea tangerina TaxID=84725 RepID=A0A2T0SYY1_9PSEU|nr:hypothetical protein [Umezawaea tangerina]PRY38622.1 hypothetical protein CLV43_10822 [Umezawaea tangerina]
MHLATYLGMLRTAEQGLADAFGRVATGHAAVVEVADTCRGLARVSESHVERLTPVVRRYGARTRTEVPYGMPADSPRSGEVGLLRDLLDLYALTSFVDLTWAVVTQAARGVRDSALLDVAEGCEQDTDRQLAWLRSRVKHSAPSALIPTR